MKTTNKHRMKCANIQIQMFRNGDKHEAEKKQKKSATTTKAIAIINTDNSYKR